MARKWLQRARSAVAGCWWFSRDLIRFRRLLASTGDRTKFRLDPRFFDRVASAHGFDAHYVYMSAWALAQLAERRPPLHVDVGSWLPFVAMAHAVTQVAFVDVRPVRLDINAFRPVGANILELPFASGSIRSLSCLHVAEHIGLGRYGDRLEARGTAKACAELQRVLAAEGDLLFAVPIGRPAICFNAHRILRPEDVLALFPGLALAELSVVDDRGHFARGVRWEDYASATYACGLFRFRKE